MPRKTEVEENSNQGMVDRVKMRTGDTGENPSEYKFFDYHLFLFLCPTLDTILYFSGVTRGFEAAGRLLLGLSLRVAVSTSLVFNYHLFSKLI